MSPAWRVVLPWSEIKRGPRSLVVEPGETERGEIARALEIPAIGALRAELDVRPWLDGVEIEGRLEAGVTYICGVTLDAFQSPVESDIHLRLLPAGSRNAPPPPGPEALVELEADDPPDIIDGEGPDLAAIVLEHLALALDPFPRKPDAILDTLPPEAPSTPFAALGALLKKPEQ